MCVCMLVYMYMYMVRVTYTVPHLIIQICTCNYMYVHYRVLCVSGYETMSVTTSPGTSEGPTRVSPKPSPSPPLPPLPPLGESVDPVALIDARIKVISCTLVVDYELMH